MATGPLATSIEASLNFNGVIYALDDQTLVSKNGSGLTLYQVNTDNNNVKQQFIPLPSICTALNVAPYAKLVVAAVGTREPSLLVFTYGHQTLTHTMTLQYPPNVANDSQITALAISRDGQRILSCTNLPNYQFILHNGTNGEIIPQSEPFRTNGLITKLSFCPGNPDLVMGSGINGLVFYHLTKSYTTVEITPITAEIPSIWSDDTANNSKENTKTASINSVPVAALAAIMDEPTDGMVPSAVTRHKHRHHHSHKHHFNQMNSIRAIMEFINESVQADAPGSGVSSLTADYAAMHVANKRGRNVWLGMTWISEQTVAATNGAGDVLIYLFATGKIVKRFNFNSTNTLINLESDPGTVATSIGTSTTHLILGCSDGYVRYLTLPDKGEDVLTTEHGFFLTSSLQLSCSGNNDSSLIRGTALCVTSIVITPSYNRIYGGTLYGSIHNLPSTSKDLMPSVKSVRRNSNNFQITVNQAIYESSPSKSTITSTFINSIANTDNRGQFLNVTPVPTNESYCITAHSDNSLRLWSCTTKNSNDMFGPVARCLSHINLGAGLGINTKERKAKEQAELDDNLESKDSKETEDTVTPIVSPLLTPKTVVCITSHARLPLIAVGCLDGTIYLFRISNNTNTNTLQFSLVSQDNSHTTAITSLLFSDVYIENKSILISISSKNNLLVIHDVGTLLSTAVGSTETMNSAIGFCKLPSHASNAITCVCWSTYSHDTLTLLLGTSSGYLLSLPIHTNQFPNPIPVSSYSQLVDYTKQLSFRVRFNSGISGLVTSYLVGAGTNASPTVVFVSIVGEMSLSLLPIDAIPATPIKDISDITSYPVASSDSFTKLNAHKRSAVCLAISPIAYASSSVILASGGMDGALTILLLSIGAANNNTTSLRVNVTGSSYTTIHSGTITNVKFSSDGHSLSVVAGLDGHCTTVSLSGDNISKAESTATTALGNKGVGRTASPSEAALLRRSNDVTVVSASSTGTYKGILEAINAAHEAAAIQEHSAVHQQLLQEVQTFRDKLHTILQANEAAPSLERLERTEFIIDQTGADNILAEYNQRMRERKETYAKENAILDADINRIKSTCVDTSEAMACEIRALTTDVSVRNFPIRKRRNSEHQLMEKMINLRAIEISTTVNERGIENITSTTTATGTNNNNNKMNGLNISWKGLANRLPSDNDWLYYTGLLAPSLDIAKQHDDILSTKSATGGATNAAAANDKKGDKGGKPADAPAEGADGAAEGENKEGGAGDKEKEEAKGLLWEGIEIIKYLYHPLSVRTPAQKRTQRMLLTELLRATQAKFNSNFDKLRNEKHEVLDGIKVRHNRLKEILTELGTPVIHMTEHDTKSNEFTTGTHGDILNAVLYAAGLTPSGLTLSSRPKSATNERPTSAATTKTNTSEGVITVAAGRTPIGPVPGENGMMNITDPFLAPSEDPQSILKVTDAEIGMVPYVSPAEQQRRAEEAERKRRAAAANKDDAPERALMDMMGGTLEGKDELTALAESLVREPWMDEVPEADFTPEQKSAYAAYKVRLQAFEDEKAKARNALNSEMTKLVQELKDLVAAFDEKVTLLSKLRTTTASVIAAQELYMTKLALAVQVRQHTAVRDSGLQAKFDSLIPYESAAAEAHENFKVFVERQASRVEELQQRDKALDTTFRGSIKEAVGTLDSDIVKMLQTLFRKRETTTTQAAVKATQEAEKQGSSSSSSAPSGTSPPRAALKRQQSNFANLRRNSEDGSLNNTGIVDPFAYYAQTVSKAIDDEIKQQNMREAVLAPLTKADCPDGYSNLADDPVWPVLNNLRKEKIASEFLIQDETKLLDNMKNHLALLASRFEKRKGEIDSVAAERDSLAAARELALLDVEVLLRLRMGQDEVSANLPDGRPHPGGGNPNVQWNDAMLVPGDIIENVNKDIRKLGQIKVDHLNDIKTFKKGLRYQQWEAEYRSACTSDIHEFHRDLQLMRAVGPVKDFIVGINVASKARQEVEKAEQKLAHYRRAHIRNIQNMEKTTNKLEKEVVDKEHTVQNLSKTTNELKEAVTLRETILRSRKGGNGPSSTTSSSGETNHAAVEAQSNSAVAEKMHNIAIRSKLTGIAKAQAEEIAALQIELHRLRTKSYAAL